MPGAGRLTVRLSRTPQTIVLAVEDEGTGMEPGQVLSASEPFESFTTRGIGLGLAIVYRIVREHGGDIAIESAPERGTRVEVRLPVARKGTES
jgi:signal transduction histidine kinase